MRLWASRLAAIVLAGCSAAHKQTPPTAFQAPPPVVPAAPMALRGTVQYEARQATPQGLSLTTELRPARFVALEARAADGAVLARTTTDADGRFSLDAPAGAVRVAAVAHVQVRGHEIWVSPSESPRGAHALEVTVATAGAPLAMVARDAGEDGAAGAFHIADTVLRGLDATLEWTGRNLPPVLMRWGRGVTSNWSFYVGERPARSGRHMIELLGGPPGQHAASDTDEHDEGIVLHELGHYVFDMLSTNSSTGGGHPPGSVVNPGLAWEEGRATWFAMAVLRDPNYRDTVGDAPGGHLRVDFNLEHVAGALPLGLGSEVSTEEVLWDLSDGVTGLADDDHDGLALGPEVLMRAMMADRTTPGAYPCLASFLRALVRAGSVQEPALRAMLAATGQPAEVLPEDGPSVWPVDLALPGRAGGKIDGLTTPAPSGGPPRPDDGMDAVRVYRVHPTRAGRLTVRLTVQGSGRPQDHTDLDVELRDMRGEMLAASRGTTPTEVITRPVEPGYFVIYVRDGGSGNRARYGLEVSLSP